MASQRTYTWKDGDQLWFLGARFLGESGYNTVSELVEAIRTANPQILSWSSVDVAGGTIVSVPYLDT